MSELKLEIRKLLATYIIKFLNWVLPDGDFKENYNRFLIQNLMKL